MWASESLRRMCAISCNNTTRRRSSFQSSAADGSIDYARPLTPDESRLPIDPSTDVPDGYDPRRVSGGKRYRYLVLASGGFAAGNRPSGRSAVPLRLRSSSTSECGAGKGGRC